MKYKHHNVFLESEYYLFRDIIALATNMDLRVFIILVGLDNVDTLSKTIHTEKKGSSHYA